MFPGSGALSMRVRKGIRLLDDQLPEWYLEIDLNSFYIDLRSRCIIGQLFATYDEGLLSMGIMPGQEWGWGFSLDYSEQSELAWNLLQSIWRSEIHRRRPVHA